METKKLPVGISDFKDMVTGGYYYVDKTLFIGFLPVPFFFPFFLLTCLLLKSKF
jgi:hypothetical protein